MVKELEVFLQQIFAHPNNREVRIVLLFESLDGFNNILSLGRWYLPYSQQYQVGPAAITKFIKNFLPKIT